MLFKTLSRHNLLLYNVLNVDSCFYLRVDEDESVCCYSSLALCYVALNLASL